MLDIRLFGSLFVRQEEEIVVFPTEQARVLLAYLVMKRQRPFPRSQLALFFWPDLPEKAAFRNFRQTLLRLRRALGDSDNLETPIILADRLTVQFNPAYPLALDVEQFQQTLQLIKTGEAASARREMYLLEKATAVYGGAFLADVLTKNELFDEWVVRERERYLLQALTALERLAVHYEQNGRYPDMAAAARRQIELEPWREEAYQQLMHALWAQGKRTETLAQYEKLKAILQTELAVMPNEAVMRLRDRILKEQRPETAVDPALGRLPLKQAPFFGRQPEIAALTRLLLQENERLVTLIGDGGAGKSRLATAVGRQLMPYFPQGVWFVPLAAIRSEDQNEQEAIASQIAQTIGLSFQGTEKASAQVTAYLQEREMLLILDNLEQLRDGVDFIGALLQSAPALALLCTSRQPLYLQAEYRFPLDGLPLPGVGTAATAVWETQAALQLFAERARRVGRPLSIAEADTALTLCRLVDGLPLAIELMAAALDKGTLAETAVALQQSYDALETSMRDLPARHRSMRAAFNYAWGLLSPAGQTVFVQLSIFRGAFSADAAFQISAATTSDLNALAEKSLLQRLDGGYYALHERLRQYTHERLAQHPRQMRQAVEAHMQFYMQYVIDHGERITRQDGLRIIKAFAKSIDNMLAAWRTAVEDGRYDLLWQAASGLFPYFALRQQYRAMARLYKQTIAQLTAQAPDDPLARRAVGWLSCFSAFSLAQFGAYEGAEDLLRQTEAIARTIDDPALSMTLAFYWGDFYHNQGNFDLAEPCFDESLRLAQAQEDALFIAFSYNFKGAIAYARSEIKQVKHYMTLALQTAKAHQLRYMQTHIYLWLGMLYQDEEDYQGSQQAYENAMQISREFEDQAMEYASALELSRLYRNLGDFEAALTYVNKGIPFYTAANDIRMLGLSYERRGTIRHMMGDYTAALLDFEEALLVRNRSLPEDDCDVLGHMARGYTRLGAYDKAAEQWNRVAELALGIESKRHLAEVMVEKGCLALITGQTAVAEQLLQTAVAPVHDVDKRLLNVRLAHEQAQLSLAQGRWEQAETCFLAAKELNAALEGMATIVEDVAGALLAALERGNRETAVRYLEELMAILEKRPSVPKGQRGLWSRRVAHRALTAFSDPRAAAFEAQTNEIIEERMVLIFDKAMQERYETAVRRSLSTL